MSWANLSHLTKLVEPEKIAVKGPGELMHAARPDKAIRIAPILAETSSGGPNAPHPQEVAHFIERQAKSTRRYKVDPKLRLQPWLNEAITQSKQDLDVLVAKTIEHLRKAVNEQSLLEVQGALNELTRTPQGTVAVRRHLSTATMKSIIQLSKRKV